MVARRILVPPVRVRILPRQLLKIAVSWLSVDCNFLFPYLHNICTTESENFVQNSSSFKVIHDGRANLHFLTARHSPDDEQSELCHRYKDCSGIFCDHSGASDGSVMTVASLSRRIHTSLPKRGRTMIRPIRVGHLSHNPNSVYLISQPDTQVMRIQSVCGYFPMLTPMPVPIFKHDTCGGYQCTPTSHTIADKVSHWRDFVQIWNPQKFFGLKPKSRCIC